MRTLCVIKIFIETLNLIQDVNFQFISEIQLQKKYYRALFTNTKNEIIAHL